MNKLHFYKAKVVKETDGDTFKCEVDAGFNTSIYITVRLLEVDAPEIRGVEKEMGRAISKKLYELLDLYDNDIFIQTIKKDSFGRWLSYCWVDQGCKGSINDKVRQWSLELIENGMV